MMPVWLLKNNAINIKMAASPSCHLAFSQTDSKRGLIVKELRCT